METSRAVCLMLTFDIYHSFFLGVVPTMNNIQSKRQCSSHGHSCSACGEVKIDLEHQGCPNSNYLKKFIFVGLNFPSVYCKLGDFCTYFSTISKEITHRMTHFLPCLYPSIAVHYGFDDWVLIYLGHFTVQSTAVLRDVGLSSCLYLLYIMQVFAYRSGTVNSAIHKAAGRAVPGFAWYNSCGTEKCPLAVNGSRQQE